MKYQQILPTEQLRKYIRGFWTMEGSVSEVSPKTFKIIADGCPGLIFQENVNSFSDSNKKLLPKLFLHGLTTNHSEKTVKGNFRNISIHFKPTALKSIFGIDAHELTDNYTDLNSLCNINLTEQLANATSTGKRIEILTLFLIESLERNQEQKIEKTHYALDLLQKENSPTSLQKIQQALNISERSLERMFKENIGVSPKLFARIARFQMSLNDIRSKDYSKLTDIAYNNNYADQSHYIREFKAFSGVSPQQFIRQANEQVENFPEWDF
ncbi:MAG TPA: AraC family transcriptional regulator [Cyclobacteriaceae bacterium]|jgi:AraC-like DNA-binding protein|nr:AraC family transcriptional regulator [Cyclobacteriaceae bacterium]